MSHRIRVLLAALVASLACASAALATGENWMQSIADGSAMSLWSEAPNEQPEWGISSRLIADGPPATDGEREKAAVIAQTRCDTPSGTTTETMTDCVGGVFQGWINGGNTSGRAWGVVAESNSTYNAAGTQIAVEADVLNRDPVTAEVPGTVGSKVNYWAGTAGDFPLTAAFGMANRPSGWLYGLYLRSFTRAGVYILAPSSAAPGISMQNGSTWTSAIVIPNNAAIRGRNAAGTATYALLALDPAGNVVLGGSGEPVLISGSAAQRVALTPAVALSPGDTYGSNEQEILANLQQRVAELESKLAAYGMVTQP